MDDSTWATLQRRFGYIFEGEGMYPAIADRTVIPPLGKAWTVAGPTGAIPVLAFDQHHGGVRSLGFRFGDVAYSSDVVGLPEETFEALAGLDVWIVDALRYTPHPTHAHVDLALSWIETLKPKRAILTNLHIDLDYAELSARLPSGVEPAFDGMRFTSVLPEDA
jgi:phosphoribosyl 1,2-cyclic phosphate phosphodiesterase